MSEQATGWPDGLMRLLTITWPKPTGYPPHPLEIRLHEHDTGREVLSVTNMVITATVIGCPMTAELTMLVDEEGLPLLDGRDVPRRAAFDEDDEARFGKFVWAIAEMRIADE